MRRTEGVGSTHDVCKWVSYTEELERYKLMTNMAVESVDVGSGDWRDLQKRPGSGEIDPPSEHGLRSASAGAKSMYAFPSNSLEALLPSRFALHGSVGYAGRMKRVEIYLPDEVFAGLDRDSTELAAELRAAAAAKLYEMGRVSQEVAAHIAGVGRGEFLSILSQFKVSPMQETAEEALAGSRVLLQP